MGLRLLTRSRHVARATTADASQGARIGKNPTEGITPVFRLAPRTAAILGRPVKSKWMITAGVPGTGVGAWAGENPCVLERKLCKRAVELRTGSVRLRNVVDHQPVITGLCVAATSDTTRSVGSTPD
jgi:hypothetical protein